MSGKNTETVWLINDDTNPRHIKSEKDKMMVCLGSLPIGEAEVYFKARGIFVLIVNIMWIWKKETNGDMCISRLVNNEWVRQAKHALFNGEGYLSKRRKACASLTQQSSFAWRGFTLGYIREWGETDVGCVSSAGQARLAPPPQNQVQINFPS